VVGAAFARGAVADGVAAVGGATVDAAAIDVSPSGGPTGAGRSRTPRRWAPS